MVGANASRSWLAPGARPRFSSVRHASATAARVFASASGAGSQATTSSPEARHRAAHPEPMTPAPTIATRSTPCDMNASPLGKA